MAQKGRWYKVDAVPSGLRSSYPLKEVKPGTVVKCIEGAPKGTLDVIDVETKGGQVKNVYSFQLDKLVKAPTMKRRK